LFRLKLRTIDLRGAIKPFEKLGNHTGKPTLFWQEGRRVKRTRWR
jgi:hypothetical protein